MANRRRGDGLGAWAEDDYWADQLSALLRDAIIRATQSPPLAWHDSFRRQWYPDKIVVIEVNHPDNTDRRMQ